MARERASGNAASGAAGAEGSRRIGGTGSGFPPRPAEHGRRVQCLKYLETSDGAWTNERGVKVGATNATAAAVTLLRQLSMPVAPSVGDWLLARGHVDGGFLAAPAAPLPDLLSTATALHALAGLERDFAPLKERCLDFIDTLWTNEGGFHGHWGDDTLDCNILTTDCSHSGI